MKILKEERLQEFRCPKCGSFLEFSHNEMRNNFKWYVLTLRDPTTGNGWFYCEKCSINYLIEDYENEVQDE